MRSLRNIRDVHQLTFVRILNREVNKITYALNMVVSLLILTNRAYYLEGIKRECEHNVC
jgi:hypothetical protein